MTPGGTSAHGGRVGADVCTGPQQALTRHWAAPPPRSRRLRGPPRSATERTARRSARGGTRTPRLQSWGRPFESRDLAVPKIDIPSAPQRQGVGYPQPFAALSAHRLRRKLADAGGLTDFGVNLTRLPPGEWSSQRHWHSHEDEFVFVLEGQVVLIEDGGETTLVAGEAAAFPKGSKDGHHMINRSNRDAVYLEIGSRRPDDVTICSDVDMMSSHADGRFLHKDGTPFVS